MPKYEQRDNSGVLFKNDEKASMPQKEREMSTQADYNGNIKVAGVDYWLNAWLKRSKAGVTYLSVSVQPKKKQQKEETPSYPPMEVDQSDVPF